MKEKIFEYKNYLFLIILIIGLIVFNIYTMNLIDYEDDGEKEFKLVEKEEKPNKIKVDIKGEVNAAGVYELDKGSRVNDLIEKAGGITKNGDTSIINLSKKLEDEMVVIIYTKNEAAALKENKQTNIKEICPKINNACPEKELETLTDNQNETKQTVNNKISINNATEEDLQKLNGIGQTKAKAIIKYREENGNFEKIEDIKNVKGIGDSAFEKIKDQITI